MLTRFILLIICYSSISIGELTKKEIRTYRKDTETLRALATPRSSVQRGCNTKTILRSSSSPLVELSVFFCVSEYFFLF